MTKFATLGFLILFVGSSLAVAQSDEVRFNAATNLLSYSLSYERALANAEARNCEQPVFENGLIHSVLRNLFLYLPLEASYYEGVQTLEVRVESEDAELPVLYARASLESLSQINSRFRIFMNSFASTRTGACFAVPQDTLQQWLNTLSALGGQAAADRAVIELSLAEILTLEELAPPVFAVEAEPELDNTEVLEPPAEEEADLSEPVQEADAPNPVEEASATEFEVVPLLSEERRTAFEAAENVLEGGTDYAARIETSKGTLVVDLFEDQVPVTVNNFVFLARNQFYDGLPFHRVLEDFMAQTGDPLGSGAGGPGYQFPDEISPELNHSAPGVLSMANAGANTNGSQFFITLEPTPWLDGQYSVFGAVTAGVEVLDELNRTDPNEPIAVATLDTTLGTLETQNVDFAGGDSLSFDTYLLDQVGEIPADGERITLADYDILIATDPNTEQRLLAFWPASDRIVSVEILAR